MKRTTQKRLIRQVVFGVIVISLIWMINWAVSNAPAQPPVKAAANIPENHPLIEDVDLMVWARNAAIASYTFAPQSINNNLSNCAYYYTPEGWQNYYSALKASHNLDVIRDKHYTVSAKSLQTPQILDRGLEGNVYAWRVQLPIEVLWHSASGDIVQKLMITLKVRRTNNPIDFSGPGVAIEKFVAIPVASSSDTSNQQLAQI